ncbi:hypothetical protein [Streptomyces sp. NPDC090025]|uniref:hypothetical protein n=1 Tax=Streptomyces sp. NPDC090025 TaxID=3365922 RepID=UPI0038378ED8
MVSMVPARFLYVVLGARQRPVGDAQRIGWRLVGANHRELGRSALMFADPAECLAAVVLLRERIADGRALLTTTGTAGGWGWRLEIDQRPVAVSGRPYQRQRDCQYNLGQFLNAVPVAELAGPFPVRSQLGTLPKPAGGFDRAGVR